MFNTPYIIVIPFLDLPVLKLRCSLAHGIVSHLSPVIFHFLSALMNKMSNFFAVITSAFVLVHGFAGNSRTLSNLPLPPNLSPGLKFWFGFVWYLLLPLLLKFCPLGLNVPLFWFLQLSLTFCAPWPQFPNDPPP